MKRYFYIIILIIFTLPTLTFAATVNDCDPGTLECVCHITSTPIDQTAFDQSNPQESCQSLCKTLSASNAAITKWAVQCKINSTLTPINEGDVNVPITVAIGEELGVEMTQPQLGVEIPGLQFSPSVVAGGEVASNYIGEYVSAIYAWALGAGSILAVVLIMIAGLEYILARGDAGQIDKAKKRMGDAAVGIVLLLCAYTIAYFVDPSSVIFETLGIKQVQRIEYIQEDSEDWPINPRTDIPPGEGETITGDSNINMQGNVVNPELIEPLKKAAAEFHAATGEVIKVSSGFRPPAKQLELFYRNCLLNGGYCSPPTGIGIPSSATLPNGNKIYTKTSSGQYIMDSSLNGLSQEQFVSTLEQYVNPSMGAHLSGVAVDAWCSESAYGNYTFGTDCQVALMTALMNNGFCRLASEVWHFEYDQYKVSGGYCSLTQDKWSFQLHSTTINYSNCLKMDGKSGVCQEYR